MLPNLDLPQKPGLFITGTGTAVGKTVIAGAVAVILREQGLKVGVFKPISTGCKYCWEGLVSAETRFLATCANTNLPLDIISPVAYVTTATPVVCAVREARPVDFEAIAAAYRHVCDDCDIVLVEGVGGVREPLDNESDLLDLAAQLNLPVVIVTHAERGTVNHTLMTLDCVRAADLRIAGVVVNYWGAAGETVTGNTAPAVIADFGQVHILAQVPYDETVDLEQAEPGELVVTILSECQWKEIAGA